MVLSSSILSQSCIVKLLRNVTLDKWTCCNAIYHVNSYKKETGQDSSVDSPGLTVSLYSVHILR